MRITTVLGSPRRQGNTAKVLGWIEELFRGDGHDVDSANILDYRVQGCGECMACKRGTVELCSIGDDVNALFRRMVAADLVLVAAPVFCWGFPALCILLAPLSRDSKIVAISMGYSTPSPDKKGTHMDHGLPVAQFVALLLTGALSLAAWIFWTWMLWTIMTEAQEQSVTLQSILAALRKTKPRMSEAQGAAIGEHATLRAQQRPSEADATEDRMALEAMGFSDETTKPKPKGER